MDPLGNIPLFLSTLKTVDPARRRLMLLREIGFAYVVLLACARSKMKAVLNLCRTLSAWQRVSKERAGLQLAS